MAGKILKNLASNNLKCWLFEHDDGTGILETYTIVKVGNTLPDVFGHGVLFYNLIAEKIKDSNFSYHSILSCASIEIMAGKYFNLGKLIYDKVIDDFLDVVTV